MDITDFENMDFKVVREDGFTYVQIAREKGTGDELILSRYDGPNEAGELIIADSVKDVPVTGIMDQAFKNDDRIKRLVLGANMVTVGAFAFSNCVNIAEIVFDDKLRTIGECAFFGIEKLAEIKLNEGLEVIGDEGFAFCENVKKVNFPVSLTKIGSSAFLHLHSLKEIEFPALDVEIGEAAFAYCRSCRSVFAPGMVVPSLGFAFCEKLRAAVFGTLARNGGYFFLRDRNLRRVSAVWGISHVGKSYFVGCNKLKNIDGIEPIDLYYLLYHARTMEDGTLGYSKRGMGVDVAYSIGDPDKIVVPAKVWGMQVKNLGAFCFFGNEKLTSVALPRTIRTIGPGAFKDDIMLAKVSLPKGIEGIGRGAFRGDFSLKEVSLPESVTAIGEDVFEDCRSLRKVKLSKNIREIGERVFAGCSELTDIDLPENLARLDMTAFLDCSRLGSLIIPKNVRDVVGSTNAPLASLTVDEENPWLDSREGCNCVILKSEAEILTGSPHAFIPLGIKSIRKEAFWNVRNLGKIHIPASVTYIGDEVFCDDANLTVVFDEGSSLDEWDIREFDGSVVYGNDETDA